jgi:hypothetical protein
MGTPACGSMVPLVGRVYISAGSSNSVGAATGLQRLPACRQSGVADLVVPLPGNLEKVSFAGNLFD